MLHDRAVRVSNTLYSAFRTKVNIKASPDILFSFSFEKIDIERQEWVCEGSLLLECTVYRDG